MRMATLMVMNMVIAQACITWKSSQWDVATQHLKLLFFRFVSLVQQSMVKSVSAGSWQLPFWALLLVQEQFRWPPLHRSLQLQRISIGWNIYLNSMRRSPRDHPSSQQADLHAKLQKSQVVLPNFMSDLVLILCILQGSKHHASPPSHDNPAVQVQDSYF